MEPMHKKIDRITGKIITGLFVSLILLLWGFAIHWFFSQKKIPGPKPVEIQKIKTPPIV